MDLDLPLALAGLGVGFVVGLTGMGGGALMTPLLVLVFKVPPLAAVSSDLVASMVMKPIGGGVHLRRGTVNLRLVGWLTLGSVPAAFASVWALHLAHDQQAVNDFVQRAVGVALLLASVGLTAKGAFSGRRTGADDALAEIQVRRARTLLIGVFGGVMVGLTSVGSGSLMMVLLLLLYPALSSRQLVGTDLVQAIPLVASAAIAHLLFGSVQLDVTASLLVGAVPGVYLGARISSRAPDHVVRPILAAVLVVSGLKMLGVASAVVGVVGAALVAIALATGLRHRGSPVVAYGPSPRPPAGEADPDG
ncbi:MAG: sulfite exporter TauE/SafE family protein [Acidimicrobiales bacterium]